MSENKPVNSADYKAVIMNKKPATGGYSERYGGGYCSGYVAPEIRDASTYLSEAMKQQAEQLGLQMTQSRGYLNFGAGIKVHMPDYVITLPTAFGWQKDYYCRELIAYSRDCEEDIYTSPLVLEIERVKLLKPLTDKEFRIRQFDMTRLVGADFQLIELDGYTALLMSEDGLKVLRRIYILLKNGCEIFTLRLIFSPLIDNIDEITKRICYSLKFTDRM